MADYIEVRAFMDLAAVFKQRNWGIPYRLLIQERISGQQLLKMLTIEREKVEVLFINGKAFSPDEVIIQPGDRVALVPPGTPGPYRVLMGFVKG